MLPSGSSNGPARRIASSDRRSIDEHGDASTLLVDAAFIDLDGDGVLEIVNAPPNAPLAEGETELQLGMLEVFKFDGQCYTFSKALNFFGTFVRHPTAPAVRTRTFSVERTDIPYLLKITNGDRKGANRVSSAVVSLNGVVVVGPERFSQQVSDITVQVTLQVHNELRVELKSDPGSQILLTIEPKL